MKIIISRDEQNPNARWGFCPRTAEYIITKEISQEEVARVIAALPPTEEGVHLSQVVIAEVPGGKTLAKARYCLDGQEQFRRVCEVIPAK